MKATDGPRSCEQCGRHAQANGLFWFSREKPDIRVLCVKCVESGYFFTAKGEPKRLAVVAKVR